jgi:hypothetical protein
LRKRLIFCAKSVKNCVLPKVLFPQRGSKAANVACPT